MKIAFSKNPKADAKVIDGLLEKYNLKFAPKDKHKEFVVVLKDGDKIVGGLVGGTYWEWMYVKTLIVSEKLRGGAYGSKMMEMAEDYAKKKGMKYVHLETHSFQAPGFYKKLGYKQFAKYEHHPGEHIRYSMFKELK